MISRWMAALAAACALHMATAPAHAQYFGQNKVQYRSHDWQVLESEHFDLYFYEGERGVAIDAARIAERAYDRLSQIMDHEVQDKIPLIVYASHTDFESTNVSPGHIGEGTEGVTELMKRRVFLPFTGSYPEFLHVLEHELVHAFQLDIMLGRAENVLSNPMTYVPPLWMMEGMAEYLSSEEIDAHTRMWLRDAALQGYLISLEDLSFVGDIRVYRFGQAVMAYIGERFGEQRVASLFKKAVQLRSLPRAVEETLGLSMKRLSEDWTQHVRRTYLPMIADHLKPDEFARRLTQGPDDLSSFNLAVSVDPTGDRFIFISDRSLYNDVYLASAIDGKVDRRLIKGERTGNFESLRFFRTAISWSPDGGYLALPARDTGRDVIVIYDIDRRREVARLNPGLDGMLSPAWSPDGERLVFTGIRDGHPDLYLINRDGSGLRRLTESRHTSRDPQWSPDGTRIAFTTDIGPRTDFDELRFGDFRIGVIDVATGEVRVPDGQEGKCINPQWSPEGDRILFVSDRTGISNIYVMDLDGANVRQLTNVLTGVTGLTPLSPCVSFSRDGSRLLFTAFSRGGFDIYALDYPLGVPEGDDSAPRPEAWIVDALGLPVEGVGEVTVVGSGTPAPAPDEPGRPSETPADTSDVTSVPVAGSDGNGLLADADPVVSGDFRPADATRDTDTSVPGSEAGGRQRPGGDAADGERPDRERRGGDGGMASGPAFASPGEPDGEVIGLDAPGTIADNAFVEEGEDEVDELAAVSLPDSSSFSYRDYRLRFSPDFVAANGLFASNVGLAAQTAIGFSDVLGNHQFVIGASIYGSLLDADLFLSYANLANRINWGASLFQYRSDFVVTVPSEEGGDDQYISQIHRGVEVALSRPFNRFRRLELGLALSGIEEREFGSSLLSASGPTTYIDIPGNSGSRFFVNPRAALILDNVVYGSTGPISGERSRFEVDRAVGGVDYTTLFADYRRYLNIRQRYVLAFRAVTATSFGAEEQSFRIGGPYTLRGYDFGEVTGSSLALANLEFRYPLIDFVKLGWPLPIAFAGIRGIMFFDAGAAWNDAGRFKPIGGQSGRSGLYLNDVRAAWGFGARMNLFGFLVARWDLARKTDLKSNIGPWLGRFSLGAEF